MSGDVSGTATMNNLKDVTINTTIQNNSVALGTDTTGNYIATIAGTSNEISVSNSGSENANVTLSLPTTTSISSGKTLDVSSGTFTTSTAQQQTIVSGGPVSIFIKAPCPTWRSAHSLWRRGEFFSSMGSVCSLGAIGELAVSQRRVKTSRRPRTG